MLNKQCLLTSCPQWVRALSVTLLLIAGRCHAQPLDPQSDYRFGAVTWMQKAAEYHLLTQQTYRLALSQLVFGLQDSKWSADEAQIADGGFESKTPAVILDLDETVLDNSAYNARNILQGKSFSVDTWNDWCQEAKAGAIPGALEFVQAAEALGTQIFYLTNREDVAKQATVRNLCELGFSATEENVLTMNKQAGRGDDKLSRRAKIAKNHRIILLIGDSMGDLCDGMDAGFENRNQLAAAKVKLLGSRWIILPNPVYGGWQRGLPKGAAALDTKM